MYLEELLEIINENSIIKLWDAKQSIIGIYDGKESINEDFNYCEITDIFSDKYQGKEAIGIEIDTSDFLIYQTMEDIEND